MLDTTIIGAGIAGCYCAYRLTQARFEGVAVFEQSERIGGRLWSPGVKSEGWQNIDAGAMYFADAHQNVSGLAQSFGLEKTFVNWRQTRRYLRGRNLDDRAFREAGGVPYKLSIEEAGKTPRELIAYALQKIVPRIGELWPFAQTGPYSTPQAAGAYLRGFEIGGRALPSWGLWNLLQQRLSNEAYELLSATLGSTAALRNANAYNAISTMMWEAQPGQSHYRLTGGNQQLALALRAASEPAAAFHTLHRLRRVSVTWKCFRLHFETPDGDRVVETRDLILALPKRAIELIEIDEALVGPAFYADLEAVTGVPASKVFLRFERRWWGEAEAKASGGDGEEEVNAVCCDLPMRQAYYFEPHEQNGPALLMASYADDVSSSFWSGLVDRNCADAAPDWLDAQAQHAGAPQALVDSVMDQLRLLHEGVELTAPVGAAFFDWSKDPFGGAWHAWAPHVESWVVRERMRKPNPKLPFFTCGEAFAQPQGWVEGALNNADMLLQEHFGLARPAWVGVDYVFEV